MIISRVPRPCLDTHVAKLVHVHATPFSARREPFGTVAGKLEHQDMMSSMLQAQRVRTAFSVTPLVDAGDLVAIKDRLP